MVDLCPGQARPRDHLGDEVRRLAVADHHPRLLGQPVLGQEVEGAERGAVDEGRCHDHDGGHHHHEEAQGVGPHPSEPWRPVRFDGRLVQGRLVHGRIVDGWLVDRWLVDGHNPSAASRCVAVVAGDCVVMMPPWFGTCRCCR